MNRIEDFINWFGWSVKLEDCDPSLFMTNYFFDRFEYNKEQKLWLIWLYGTTYYWPTAYIIWNEFPDMELVSYDRLNNWNTLNYKRLRYQTDTKWNKGHLPNQFLSYKKWVGDKSQREAISEHISENPIETFNNLWKISNNWYKFGRYSSWFYLQTMKHCFGINLEPENLFLADYSGSRSHRNGLCYALGKQEWVDKKLTKIQIEYLEEQAKQILIETRNKFPELEKKIDYFSMETCLCSFKKLFRERNGRYLGYYLDRQAEEIKKVEDDGWNGIDWNPMWQAREETCRKEYLSNNIDKEKMKVYMNSNIIDYNNTFSTNKLGLEVFF